MIRYDIADDQLEEQIKKEAPTWLPRAAKRTEDCRKLNAFDGKSGIWSEIKPVYMRLQHNKCAYCERRLEGEPYGLLEHDVEHYRPKNGVKHWPDAKIQAERKIDYKFATGDEYDEGYYLLAFHIYNYIAACKSCNTPLKSSYFPIAGLRGPQSDDPSNLAAERPFLPYPISSSDDDPEDIITFEGIVPKPVRMSGHRRLRARVTIDFFELDTREELIRGRSEIIRMLWAALLILRSNLPAVDSAFAKQTITQLQSAASPHTNCARSFLKLYKMNPAHAEQLAKAAMEYLDGLDPTTV